MQSRTTTKRNRFRRLLESEDHDPIAGVSNLFDVAMVFAVALLVALFTQVPTSQQARDGLVPQVGDRLEHFQTGDREAGGQGVRLGIAYRLPSGEVIYVPEKK